MKKIRWILVASLVVLIIFCVYFFVKKTPQVLAPTTDQTWFLLPVGWQTSVNTASGFSFSYPTKFSGNVWSPTTWPGVVMIISQKQDALAIACPDLKNSADLMTATQGQTKEGLPYSLYKNTDIGAGSLYATYCYVIQGKKNNYVFDFTVRSHSGCGWGECGAYCDTPNEQECRDLDRIKTIEEPLNQIVASFKLLK